MPELSYYNIGYVSFTSPSGPGSANAITALVSVSNPKPALVFLKTVTPYSDPYNNTTNPKNIPGALVDYTLRVTNTGPGVVDNNTLLISDPVPLNTELFLGDIGAVGSGPIVFTQGTPTSGLTYTYGPTPISTTDDLEFSNDGGVTWTYAPPATPYDLSVTPVNSIVSARRTHIDRSESIRQRPEPPSGRAVIPGCGNWARSATWSARP